MSSGAKGVRLEIITPREMFYAGEVEMVDAPTLAGQEGFMAGHVWCVKLLAEKGAVRIREAGAKELKTLTVSGGYIDIKDRFVICTDNAEWKN